MEFRNLAAFADVSPGFEPRYDHVSRPASGFRSGAARGDIRRLGPPKSEILPGERTRAVGTRRGRDCIGVSAWANAFGRVSGGYISGPSRVRVSVRRVTRCAVTSDPSLREPGGKSESGGRDSPTAVSRCFRGVCWHSGAASTQPASLRKSVKSRRLVARTTKSERKSERRKSARLPRGWWRVHPVARLRQGAVRQCLLRYKLQGIGRGGALGAASARRRPCALAAVFPSAPANWRRFVHPSRRNVFPFPLISLKILFILVLLSQRRSASGARVVAPPDLRPPRCLGVPAVQSFSSSAVSSRIPS